jgi:hypothetical protein
VFPSDYSKEERKNQVEIEGHIDAELRLRTGELADIIAEVQLMIRHLAMLLQARRLKSGGSGKHVWIRTQKRINKLGLEIEFMRGIYNKSRLIVLKLKPIQSRRGELQDVFPEMKKEHL